MPSWAEAVDYMRSTPPPLKPATNLGFCTNGRPSCQTPPQAPESFRSHATTAHASPPSCNQAAPNMISNAGMGRGVGSAGFREQVVGLGYLWETWSEAEQVVVVYSLVRRLGPVPARFLLNVLTTAPDAADLNTMEATANDPAWVSQIPEAKDGGVSDLLHHLPLLRPANTEAKMQYLSIIPKVLAHAVTSAGSQPALENARQILSYSLIHPAITGDERRALTHWLRALEDKLAELRRRPPSQQREGLGSTCSLGSASSLATGKSHWSEPPLIPPPDTGQDDTGWCGGGATAIGGSGDQSPNNSATSSRSSGCDSNPEEPCQQPHPGMRDVGVWLKSLRLHKYSPLLCNLTYEELLALDESTLESQGVTKGARHKIVLSISKLKERHKQLVQIEKEVMNGGNLFSCLNDLKSLILTPFPPYNPPSEPAQPLSQPLNTSTLPDPATSPPPPPPTLPPVSSSTPPISTNPSSYPTSSTTTTTASSASSLSTSTSSSACSLRGDDREFMKEEKDESIRPATVEGESSNSIPENDLPSQFTRVMGKVCTQLLVSVRPEDECVSAFLGLVEKCVNHEAFTAAHARRLQSWKQQIIRVWHPLPPKTKDSRHTRRWSQQYGGDGFVGGSFRVPRVSGQRHTHIPAGLLMGGKGFPTPQPHPLFPLPPAAAAAAAAASLGGLMSPRNSLPGLPSLGVGGLLSPQQFLAKRPSLQETPSELRPHITLQRTRSAPSRPHQLPLTGQARPVPPPTTSSSLAPGSGGCSEMRISGTTGTVLEPHFSPASSYSNLGPPPSSPDLADNDITDRLESLCLSVTEHALG